MTTILEQPCCDVNLVNAALDFYGLPRNYPRFFTKADNAIGLVATTPQLAGRTRRACWVQLNLPDKDAPLKKMGNADIAVVQNISLDFELPICPPACHELGRLLARWLVAQGWAEPGLPVEDSGAGCHIVIPIVPIITKDFGGGEAVNAAVARWVNKYVKPKFEQLKQENPLCKGKQLKLEAFDISRVLSLPGTFRPGNSKQYEVQYLWNGYIRQWLEPFDNQVPIRKESAILREMIIQEANSQLSGISSQLSASSLQCHSEPSEESLTPTANSSNQGSSVILSDSEESLTKKMRDSSHAQSDKPFMQGDKKSGQNVEQWLRARAAAVTMDGNHSNDFYRLMAALWAKFGDEQLIRDNARLIDELAGGRYIKEGRLERETDRVLAKVTLYPRDHAIWEEMRQEIYIAEQFEAHQAANPKGQASAAEKFVADFSQYKISTLAELAKRELPPLEWLIPDLLPAGLTLLAGPPKIGKSWLTLALAMAIAKGGAALGQWQANQKRVLYLGLEDNERRMQERAWAVAGVEPGDELPDNFHYVLESPKLGFGLAEFIEHFISQYPDTKVVFVDTLVKVRPPMQSNGNVYAQDYHCLQELKALCDEYNLAIVVVHHTNKGDKSDPFARINGSNGLIGATDSNWVLEAKEGEDEPTKTGKLTITGREIDRRSLALQFDPDKRQWLFDADASKFFGKTARSREQQEIIDFLEENCGYAFSPKEIAEALGRSRDAVRYLLGKLLNQQLISRTSSSKYYITNPNSDIVVEKGEDGNIFNIVSAVSSSAIPPHSPHSTHSTHSTSTQTTDFSTPDPWAGVEEQAEYDDTAIEEMLDELIPYAKSLYAAQEEADADCGDISSYNSSYIIEDEGEISTHHSEDTATCGDISSYNSNIIEGNKEEVITTVNHRSEDSSTCGGSDVDEDDLRRERLMWEILGAVRVEEPVSAVSAVSAVRGYSSTTHSTNEPLTAENSDSSMQAHTQVEQPVAASDSNAPDVSDELEREFALAIEAAEAQMDYQALQQLSHRVETSGEVPTAIKGELRRQLDKAIAHVLNMDLPTKIR